MAGKGNAVKPLTSLQIEVLNDFPEKGGGVLSESGDVPMGEDNEIEEGEASDDEVEVNVIIREEASLKSGRSSPPPPPLRTSSVEFQMRSSWPEERYDRTTGFISGISEPSEKVLSERARRFGVTDPPKVTPVTSKAIDRLYKSLDVTDEDFERGRFRPDAILVRGVKGLSSKNVYDYFQAYFPANIDWVDVDSCIVEWHDSAGPVRALIGLSCPIIPSPVDPKKPLNNEDKRKKKKKRVSSVDSEEESLSESKNMKKKVKKQSRQKKMTNADSSSSSSDSDSSSSSSSSSSNSSSSASSSSLSSVSSGSDSEEEEEMIDDKSEKFPVKAEKTEKDKNASINTEEGSVHVKNVAIPIPDGRWRLGIPCPKTKAVLLRFASFKDRKDDYIGGELNHRLGFFGLGAGKRPHVSAAGRRKMLDAQRRRAREERHYAMMEDRGKNPWGELAQNWGRKESQEDDRFDYQELLRQHQLITSKSGKRRRTCSEEEEEIELRRFNDFDSSEGESGESDVVPWRSKIKIPRMKMYADAEQKKKKRRHSKDLKSRLSGKSMPRTGDVRDRLSKFGGGNGRTQSQLDLRSRLSRRRRNINLMELDSA